MRILQLAAGLLTLLALADSAAAQEPGTVGILAPKGARYWYDGCKGEVAPPACGLRQVADHFCAITVRSQEQPPCCLPANDTTNDLIKQAFLSWGDNHPALLDTDVNKTVRDVLSAAFPCTSEMADRIPRPGENALFLPGTFDHQPQLDTFIRDWYSKNLTAMGEEELFQKRDQESEVYRLLRLPTFDHPIAIRIQKEEGLRTLFIKQLSGAGGYDPGNLVIDIHVTLSAQEWDRFMDLLDATNFWLLPTTGGEIGFDGTQTIVEAVKEGRYHVIDRWEDHMFDDIFRFANELAGR